MYQPIVAISAKELNIFVDEDIRKKNEKENSEIHELISIIQEKMDCFKNQILKRMNENSFKKK